MAFKAGLDIGTNTFLLLVVEQDASGIQVLRDEVRIVRLGQEVDRLKAFHPEAMARAEKVFREFGEILKNYPGVQFRAVATSGSRDARNSQDFFTKMRALLGFPIEIISGEAEAELSFRGATMSSVAEGDAAVLDIGGGSTEIVALAHSAPPRGLTRKSYNMGCVRLSERFLKSNPPTSVELSAMRAWIRSQFAEDADFLRQFRANKWIGVAGTATYVASSFLGLERFIPEKVDGITISRGDIEKQAIKFQSMTAEERLGLGGMDAGRADVIVAGAWILAEIMQAAGVDELKISVRGLRYGLVL